MADIADFVELRGRVDGTEKACTDHRDRLDRHDNILDDHEKAIEKINQWRTGNGARGAEDRLQEVEDGLFAYARERIIPRLNCIEGDVAAVQLIADHAIQTGVNEAVNTTLDKRERTTIAKIKAWGPYAATAVVLIGMVLDKVFK